MHASSYFNLHEWLQSVVDCNQAHSLQSILQILSCSAASWWRCTTFHREYFYTFTHESISSTIRIWCSQTKESSSVWAVHGCCNTEILLTNDSISNNRYHVIMWQTHDSIIWLLRFEVFIAGFGFVMEYFYMLVFLLLLLWQLESLRRFYRHVIIFLNFSCIYRKCSKEAPPANTWACFHTHASAVTVW